MEKNEIPLNKQLKLKNNNNPSDILFKSMPNNIKFLNDVTKDSFSTELSQGNSFLVFKSFTEIFYLIYVNEKNSIISLNLLTYKKINEIKNLHNDIIISLRYYQDIIKKRDLIMMISYLDRGLKLWNINNWECLCSIKTIYKAGILLSCFLKNTIKNFIITSNYNYKNICGCIKVFDFLGNEKKEINYSNYNIFYIDSYYDDKLKKNFIITGNDGFSISYDFDQNKLYNKYMEKDFSPHLCLIINNNEKITKLIDSSDDGNIRIWNFHSGELLNKIKASSNSIKNICLWNNEYLFIAVKENIKLLKINNGYNEEIKDLIGHYKTVTNIKKFIHPIFGECLISQGGFNDGIKLWTIYK